MPQKTLIEKCKSLKSDLEMSLELAKDIQAETKTDNLDVTHLKGAIHALDLRIKYLQKRAASENAEPKAKEESEKQTTPPAQ